MNVPEMDGTSDLRSREKTGLEPSEDTWTCQRFPESLDLLIGWRTWRFDSYSRRLLKGEAKELRCSFLYPNLQMETTNHESTKE